MSQSYEVQMTEQMIEEMTYAKFVEQLIMQYAQRATEDQYRALLLGYDHELWTPNNSSK